MNETYCGHGFLSLLRFTGHISVEEINGQHYWCVETWAASTFSYLPLERATWPRFVIFVTTICTNYFDALMGICDIMRD